jgi:hypothetical protein
MQRLTRRQMLKTLGGAALASKSAHALIREKTASYSAGLGALRLLPLGAVRPSGWLARQLRVQADGMGGHLDEFWPDVGPNSGWLGGTGESWERGPYFLDGLVPLAWLLDDTVLKAKAQRFVDWTLNNQQANGMIGPASNNDWWPRMVMVKALAQYEEVTRDPRAIPALTRYFQYQLTTMPSRPLASWARYRWQDEAYVVQWMYERTGDAKLPMLVELLRQQGYDWNAEFAHFPFERATPHGFDVQAHPDEAMARHGVNNAQGLKTAAVLFRASGDPGQREAFARQMRALDTFHGQPNGMFSCDEHLGGREPQHGSELCSVVETMFSLEVALATFGEGWIGDRIETLAYNALPGTFTDDMWAHQYDQQANQVESGLITKPWTTNGPESNLYGLAPHFGCCTANFHQGWPKFTSSLWMAKGDRGLVAALYAPSTVHATVGGVPVQIAEETDYPFRNRIRMEIVPERSVSFALHLRVPAWTSQASVTVNGKAQAIAAGPSGFATVARTWTRGDLVEIGFDMRPRVNRGFNRSVALERGPLVFSLAPGTDWVKLRERPPTADWQVFPTSAWNYALGVDEDNAAAAKVDEHAIAARPFASSAPAVTVTVPARRLDEWRAVDGVAAPPPASPAKVEAAEETVTLVPYGGAKLRITAFPCYRS